MSKETVILPAADNYFSLRNNARNNGGVEFNGMGAGDALPAIAIRITL